MTEKKRMHPITIVVSIVRTMKEGIFPLIFATFFLIQKIGLPYFILLMLAGFIFIVVRELLHWYRFTYRVEENEVRIEYGVFVKKKRYIPIERIQTINLTAGVFQRLVGVVKVEIETLGGSDSSEGELTAIPREDAKELQKLVKEAKQYKKKAIKAIDDEDTNEWMQETIAVEQTSKQVYQLSTKDLILAGMTSGRVAIIAAVLGGFISQMIDKIPDRYVERFFDGVYEQVVQLSIIFIIGLVLLVLFMTWIISVIGTMIRFGGFTVTRTEEYLHISRGLLEKVEVHVPVSRIQGVIVSESLLQQPFKLATIRLNLITTKTEDEGTSTRALLPIVKKHKVSSFLHEFLPEYAVDFELKKVPKRALPRSLFRHLFYQTVILGLIAYFVPYGAYGLLLLIPLAIQGYFVYRDRGYAISEKYCMIQQRKFLHRILLIVELRKIHRQGLSQTYFQKRKKLLTLNIFTSEGTYEVIDMEEQEGLKMEQSFVDFYKKRVRKV